MDTQDFFNLLEAHFSINGIHGESLIPTIKSERNYVSTLNENFKGYMISSESFQGFYLETLKLATTQWNEVDDQKSLPGYQSMLLFFFSIFKSIRACDILAQHGYPLPGFALLRDVKDRAIFLGAVAGQITTIGALLGEKDGGHENNQHYIRALKKEHFRVLGAMIHKNPSLEKEVIDYLRKWEDVFHSEVHLAKLSFATLLDYVTQSGVLPISPDPSDDSVATYINCLNHVTLLLTATLPLLQIRQNSFGEKWREDHEVLLKCQRHLTQRHADLGKEMSRAILVFADKMFSFPETLCYSP